MFKTLLILFALSLSAIVAGPSSAQAYFPDIFTPYMKGAEAARRANYQDMLNYQAIAGQSINNAFQAFRLTKDFSYLCQAYALGSREAAELLYKNDMRCQFIEK